MRELGASSAPEKTVRKPFRLTDLREKTTPTHTSTTGRSVVVGANLLGGEASFNDVVLEGGFIQVNVAVVAEGGRHSSRDLGGRKKGEEGRIGRG